jgi:hypothetical protein
MDPDVTLSLSRMVARLRRRAESLGHPVTSTKIDDLGGGYYQLTFERADGGEPARVRVALPGAEPRPPTPGWVTPPPGYQPPLDP